MIDVRKTWERFGWKPSEPKKPEVVSTRELDEIPPSAEIIVWFDGHEQVPEDERDVLLQLLRDAADVPHTVVGADADEDRRLREMRDLIADACGGVMLAMVQEAQG